jgi:hypothetical protein
MGATFTEVCRAMVRVTRRVPGSVELPSKLAGMTA